MKNIRFFVFLCLGFGPVLRPALQISAQAPTTAKIAFSSNRDGNWEIYLMNPDGSQQKRLTQNSARDSSPVWSPVTPQSHLLTTIWGKIKGRD